MGLRQTAEKRELSLTDVRAGVMTAKKKTNQNKNNSNIIVCVRIHGSIFDIHRQEIKKVTCI